MAMKRKREYLDMALFKKAVDEFVAIEGTEIDFNATIGEPLLDPHLLERASYVKQFPQFKSLGFVTNLQWLHKFDMDEFFKSGISWLGISTVLLGRQKYFEFFGVDRYGQALENLLRLIQENKKRGNKIVLLFTIKPMGESISDVLNYPDFKMISSLVDFNLVKAVKNQSFYVDDWGGIVKLPPYLERRPLYPRMFRPCRFLYTGLILFSNGNIGVCPCRDFEANSSLILGNTKGTTLKEAWKGEKPARLRFNWRRINIIPNICKRCSQYVY